MADDLLTFVSKALTIIAPHNVLNTLINGGAKTPIFDESSFMGYSGGYHTQMSLNEIEPGVTFSELKVPATYNPQMNMTDKGEITIYNNTDHAKKLLVEFYQSWCTMTMLEKNIPRCSYGQSNPRIGAPRVYVIPPGGAEKIEFWYNTPPAPRAQPQYEDVLRMRIVVQITDEQGKRAMISAPSVPAKQP